MTNDPSPITRGPSPSPGRSRSPSPSSHQDSTAASLNFRFLPRASLSSLHPATGPAAGGANLSIAGVGLARGTDYQCRIGPHTVPAIFIAEGGEGGEGGGGGGGGEGGGAPAWAGSGAR